MKFKNQSHNICVLQKRSHNPDEIIALVDKDDKVIGKSKREKHACGKLHREVAIFFINRQNKILIQKRDNGILDSSAAGHFPYRENYLKGAAREVKEELGLNIKKEKFKKVLKTRIKNLSFDGSLNRRFVTLFEVKGDYEIGMMKHDKTEVKSLRYYAFSEINKIIKKKPQKVSSGFKKLLNLYLKKYKL